MSDAPAVQTRTPGDVGYLPWLLQRSSSVLLLGLLAVHVAVQAYGVAAPIRWGVYSGLLDLTLGLVLLHGVLGVRTAVLETRIPRPATMALIWLVWLAAAGLFVLRVVG